MGHTSAAAARCSGCSAAVRPGAPWCTQCFAPTGPAAAPAAVVVAELAAGTWPCTTCTSVNDLALPACEACGTPFLGALRTSAPTVVLPVVGDLLAMTPLRRLGVAVAGALTLVVAFLAVTALLSLLLR